MRGRGGEPLVANALTGSTIACDCRSALLLTPEMKDSAAGGESLPNSIGSSSTKVEEPPSGVWLRAKDSSQSNAISSAVEFFSGTMAYDCASATTTIVSSTSFSLSNFGGGGGRLNSQEVFRNCCLDARLRRRGNTSAKSPPCRPSR